MPSQAYLTVPVEATAVGVSGWAVDPVLAAGIELLLILPR